MTHPQNTASIHQRLLNKAVTENRPFNELLQYYGMERFLYRLSVSAYSKQFILKGALVFQAWQAPLTRPTRDIDFLGYNAQSIDNIVHIVQEICLQPVDFDGMIFDPASVQGKIIKENVGYQGVRASLSGILGKAEIRLHLDIGFFDVVTPPPAEIVLPSILDDTKPPVIHAYPPETVISEKFQAIVELSIINSRMKDFYDIWFLSVSRKFDYELLCQAVKNTFERRKTAVPEELPVAFTAEFAQQKQALWFSFLRNNRIDNAPVIFADVIRFLDQFFSPIIFPEANMVSTWYPSTGWRKE